MTVPLCCLQHQVTKVRSNVREACDHKLCTSGHPCTLSSDYASFNKFITKRLTDVLVHHSVNELTKICPLSDWQSVLFHAFSWSFNVKVNILFIPLALVVRKVTCSLSLRTSSGII